MLGFLDWVEFDHKKKEKKNVRATSQSDQENRVIGHEGKAVGNDTKEYSTVVYDFTQSKWEDYRSSN